MSKRSPKGYGHIKIKFMVHVVGLKVSDIRGFP